MNDRRPTPELTRYSPPTTIQYDAPPSTSILPEMIPLPASPSDELELSESTVLVPSQTETTVVPEPSDSTIPVPEPELTESTVLVPTPAPDADVLTQEEVSLASLSPPLPPVHGPAADADVDRLDLDLASASESESEEEGPRTPPLAATFAHAAEFMRVLVHDEEHEHDDEGGVRVPFVKSEESKLVVVPTPTIVTAPTPTVAVAPTPTLAPIPSTTTTTSTKATPAPAPTPTQPEQPTLAQRLLENARPLGYGLTALCYGLTWYLVTQTPAALV
ncbi:hypothetical protein BDW22DRAFT_1227519 [Trametopsis cervina]|nr:hypothetical protein BDW22DRAFT_1227519 [Trametopsis cervina]